MICHGLHYFSSIHNFLNWISHIMLFFHLNMNQLDRSKLCRCSIMYTAIWRLSLLRVRQGHHFCRNAHVGFCVYCKRRLRHKNHDHIHRRQRYSRHEPLPWRASRQGRVGEGDRLGEGRNTPLMDCPRGDKNTGNIAFICGLH
jgi:hypothetical protein